MQNFKNEIIHELTGNFHETFGHPRPWSVFSPLSEGPYQHLLVIFKLQWLQLESDGIKKDKSSSSLYIG